MKNYNFFITAVALISCIVVAILLVVVFRANTEPAENGSSAVKDEEDGDLSDQTATGQEEATTTSEVETAPQPLTEEKITKIESIVDIAVESNTLTKVMYVVVPHPDDEFQAWSLIENRPDTHKVFIMLTRGEQSAYCNSPKLKNNLQGAKPPSPHPTGRWTPSCEQARINSFLGFMEDMATVDNGLSESYENLGTRGPFTASDSTVCRQDDALSACSTDLSAALWQSPYATLVWFNLGDGDLTPAEVQWAITTVLNNKSSFSINDELADSGIVGASYFNSTSASSCSGYRHSDHGAVQTALKTKNFNVGWQAAPTCAADPETVLEVAITAASYQRAFARQPESPLGVFFANYGWLSSATTEGHPDDPHHQTNTFHRHQTFWVRQ